MNKLANRKSACINDEGELIDGRFCAYCGSLNETVAEVCEQCGEYIADQGPDLRSRLQRISRHARNIPGGFGSGPGPEPVESARPNVWQYAMQVYRPYVAIITLDRKRPGSRSARRPFFDEGFVRELRRVIVLFFIFLAVGMLIILTSHR
jgi:hypothetical protein